MKQPPHLSKQVPAEEPDPAAMIRAAVERYEGPLTLYAARLVGDVDRARDVVQDTFLKLWTADAASVNGHLAAWLYRVCRNRALDVCRKEVRMTTIEKEQMETREDPRELQSAVEGSPETQRVIAMLETLTEKQQEVIRLKFQGGLSYQEIATVMDLTANHVGVLIHTALKSIREKLSVRDVNVSLPGGRSLP